MLSEFLMVLAIVNHLVEINLAFFGALFEKVLFKIHGNYMYMQNGLNFQTITAVFGYAVFYKDF